MIPWFFWVALGKDFLLLYYTNGQQAHEDAQQQMTTEKIDKFHPPKISLIRFNQNLN